MRVGPTAGGTRKRNCGLQTASLPPLFTRYRRPERDPRRAQHHAAEPPRRQRPALRHPGGGRGRANDRHSRRARAWLTRDRADGCHRRRHPRQRGLRRRLLRGPRDGGRRGNAHGGGHGLRQQPCAPRCELEAELHAGRLLGRGAQALCCRLVCICVCASSRRKLSHVPWVCRLGISTGTTPWSTTRTRASLAAATSRTASTICVSSTLHDRSIYS